MYRVIVYLVKGNPAQLSQLVRALSQQFAIPLEGRIPELMGRGVCVYQTADLNDATARGKGIIELGAHFRIEDASGRTVSLPAASVTMATNVPTPSVSGAAAGKTMMGGFNVADLLKGQGITPQGPQTPQTSGGPVRPVVTPQAATSTPSMQKTIMGSGVANFVIPQTQPVPQVARPQTAARGVSVGTPSTPVVAKQTPLPSVNIPQKPVATATPSVTSAPTKPTAAAKPAPKPAASPADAFGLDALDGASLVTLDGADNEEPLSGVTGVRFQSGDAANTAQTTGASAFAPPEDDEDLALADGYEDRAPSPKPATPTQPPKAEKPKASSMFAPPDEGADLELDLGPTTGGHRAKPTTVPPVSTTSAAKRASLTDVSEHVPGRSISGIMPVPTPPKANMPSQALASLGTSHVGPLPKRSDDEGDDVVSTTGKHKKPSAASWSERFDMRPSPRDATLFGGWFRSSPRLRVLCGFLLALALGMPLPLWHASSVMTSRVEPLRQELANARDHGDLLAQRASYRSPEELEVEIESVKTRNSIYTFLIWLSLSTVIVFFWFKLA